MDGGAWWAAVHGVAKSRTRLSDFTFTFHCHALEKEMATHSSGLAWRVPGMGEPVGYSPWGCKESNMTEVISSSRCSSIPLYIYVHHIFIHSSVNGHLSCFHVLSIVKNASMNTGVHVSFQIRDFVFSRYMHKNEIAAVQFSSVTQSCLTISDSMDCSTPGLPVHHQLRKLTQTDVNWVSDAIQPSHPLSSLSPPAFSLSQHQGPFKWVSSSHKVAKVLELQLQHQSFQWIFRTDFL